jgi:hypothetical protein
MRALHAVRPRRRYLGGIVAALVVGIAATACVPPKPAPPAGSPPQGFDACAAPTAERMQSWWTSSPFTSVGVYLGGANRACAQPNLTPSWVATVEAQGWGLLPIWVGPQAPCTTLSGTTKLPADPAAAEAAGISEGTAAANAADALGLGWLDPVYYDMEGYPRGGSCSAAVQRFASGWVAGLNQRGYIAGFYSSLCSGILDLAAVYDDSSLRRQNAVWIAAWNNSPNIFGFGAPCMLADSQWADHQRVHQFLGGHDETWGGVTLNIDSNAVDARTSRG